MHTTKKEGSQQVVCKNVTIQHTKQARKQEGGKEEDKITGMLAVESKNQAHESMKGQVSKETARLFTNSLAVSLLTCPFMFMGLQC